MCIVHKKLPHKTLCVHSARYTQCIHRKALVHSFFSSMRCWLHCISELVKGFVLCLVLFPWGFFSRLQVCFVYIYGNRPKNFTLCDKRDSQPDVFISCFTQLGFQTWSCPSDAVVVSHLTGKPNWMSGHARENRKLCSWTGVLNCALPCKRHIAGNWKKCCSFPGRLHCKIKTACCTTINWLSSEIHW